MNKAKPNLESSITKCRELVQVFRKEHDLLASGENVGAGEVLGMLKTKLQLVNTVSQHEAALGSVPPQEVSDTQREQLQELGELLETLLVLERENQVLLRNAVRVEQAKTDASGAGLRPDNTAAKPATHSRESLARRLQGIRSAGTARLAPESA